MFIERLNEVVSQYIRLNNEDDLVYARHNIATIANTLQDEQIKNWKASQYLRQKLQNYFFRQEIIHLHEAAQKEKITFIVLKGLPLALDLYPNPAMRPSGDVDILIRPEDLKSFVMLCMSLGYQNSSSDVLGSLDRFSNSNNQHYAALYKQIGNYRLDLELHTQVFASDIHRNFSIKQTTLIEVFKNIHPYDFYGTTIFTMGYLDNFIFLCVHMVKHLFWNVMCHNAAVNYVSHFSFKDLCDVGLFYKKHDMAHKSSDIVKRAKQFRVFPEVLFAMSLIQLVDPDVYNPFIDENTEYELSNYETFISKSVQVLLPELCCDFLFWTTDELSVAIDSCTKGSKE